MDVFTAMLGGEVEVPTLSGTVHLKIPAGTQPEQVFRIAGRGMPQSKNPQTKGDLYVKIKVNIPRNLTPEQKSLLEEAARKRKRLISLMEVKEKVKMKRKIVLSLVLVVLLFAMAACRFSGNSSLPQLQTVSRLRCKMSCRRWSP